MLDQPRRRGVAGSSTGATGPLDSPPRTAPGSSRGRRCESSTSRPGTGPRQTRSSVCSPRSSAIVDAGGRAATRQRLRLVVLRRRRRRRHAATRAGTPRSSTPIGGAARSRRSASERFATRIALDDEMLIVACGGHARPQFVPDSWGYEALEPAPLAVPLAAGTEVRQRTVAVSRRHRRRSLVDELAAHAAAIGGARRWTGTPIAGWESWYHYAPHDPRRHRPRERAAAARALPGPAGLRPRPDRRRLAGQAHGAWWPPNDRFPADLGELVDALHRLGPRAGLWLAPFMVEPGGPGRRRRPLRLVPHPRRAGHTLRDRHGLWALDASHPDVARLARRPRRTGPRLGLRHGEARLPVPRRAGGAPSRPRRHRHGGAPARSRRVRRRRWATTCTSWGAGCRCSRRSASATATASAPISRPPCCTASVGPQPLTHGWSGWHGIAVQARDVAARFAHRHWYDCDPDVVLAWGSDGRAPPTATRSTSRARSPPSPHSAAGRSCSPTSSSALRRRRAMRCSRTLSSSTCVGGDGFLPVDLFDAPDRPVREHAFEPCAALPRPGSPDRGDLTVRATFNWGDSPAAGIPAHGVRLERTQNAPA